MSCKQRKFSFRGYHAAEPKQYTSLICLLFLGASLCAFQIGMLAFRNTISQIPFIGLRTVRADWLMASSAKIVITLSVNDASLR
jgi:hypothetical protein